MKKYLMYATLLGTAAIVASSSPLLADNGKDGRGGNHTKDNLNGFQENPSIVTTGSGTLELRIDDETQTIEFELTYSNLEGGAPTAAHIHIGSRSFNGGVSAFFCGGGGKPPCPADGPGVTAVVTGTIIAADVVGPAAQGVEPGSIGELIRAIRAGHTYANVHNARWPSGEIRGQINDDDQRQFDR